MRDPSHALSFDSSLTYILRSRNQRPRKNRSLITQDEKKKEKNANSPKTSSVTLFDSKIWDLTERIRSRREEFRRSIQNQHRSQRELVSRDRYGMPRLLMSWMTDRGRVPETDMAYMPGTNRSGQRKQVLVSINLCSADELGRSVEQKTY
jgi:hypothetical protein